MVLDLVLVELVKLITRLLATGFSRLKEYWVKFSLKAVVQEDFEDIFDSRIFIRLEIWLRGNE